MLEVKASLVGIDVCGSNGITSGAIWRSLRKQQNPINPMSTRKTEPPTAPPAMARMFVL